VLLIQNLSKEIYDAIRLKLGKHSRLISFLIETCMYTFKCNQHRVRST